MWTLVDYAMEKFREFDWMDLGIFKLCLVSFGVLVGVCAEKHCKKWLPVIAATFFFSYLFLIYRLITIQIVDDVEIFSDIEED